jgi:hypothetical protein
MEPGRSTCRPVNKSAFLLALFLFLGAMHPVTGVSDSTIRQHLLLQRAVSVCRDGDLVFRYGNGFWSPYFRDASRVHKRFSHAGVVVYRNGCPWVVHSDAHSLTGIGTVHLERLDKFLAGATDYAFFTIQAPRTIRERIAAVACSYIGRPFDVSFDTEDASKLYCSELLMHAVNEATGSTVIKPSLIHGKTVVTIDDCYRNARVRQRQLINSGRT